MTALRPPPAPRPIEPPLPGHCPACGRRFGRRAVKTVAAWFRCGLVQDGDVVHWGCRFVRRPKA